MKQAHAVLLATLLACIGVPAHAALVQYGEELGKKAQKIDEDRITREPLLQVLDANCSVDNALKAGLSNDPTGFATALQGAQERLRSVADRLPTIAGKGRFDRVKKRGNPVLTLPSGQVLPVRNGDDILQAIATLATLSADAIERIRTGQGGDDDLSLIATNSAVMARLMVEFYTS